MYIAVHEIRVKCIDVGDTSGFKTDRKSIVYSKYLRFPKQEAESADSASQV